MGGETTNDQTRDDMWMSAKDECTNVRENTRVRVFCSHLPSVTVDRYQL